MHCSNLVMRNLLRFSSYRSGMPICFQCFFAVIRASEGAVIQVGSKSEYVELCNFSLLLRIQFLSANEKIRIFWCVQSYCVKDRFKTSST